MAHRSERRYVLYNGRELEMKIKTIDFRLAKQRFIPRSQTVINSTFARPQLSLATWVKTYSFSLCVEN